VMRIHDTDLTGASGFASGFAALFSVGFAQASWVTLTADNPIKYYALYFNSGSTRTSAASVLTLTSPPNPSFGLQAVQSSSAYGLVTGDIATLRIDMAAPANAATFIQTTAPTAAQIGQFLKYVWVDTSNSPPIINVENGGDVPTTTSTLASPDDLQIMILMGAL
jgi:hypothetical protein